MWNLRKEYDCSEETITLSVGACDIVKDFRCSTFSASPFMGAGREWIKISLSFLNSVLCCDIVFHGAVSSVLDAKKAAMEDKKVDFGDFFERKLPEKFLLLLGWLVLSRIGTYVSLWEVDRSAFQGSLDSNSLLGI